MVLWSWKTHCRRYEVLADHLGYLLRDACSMRWVLVYDGQELNVGEESRSDEPKAGGGYASAPAIGGSALSSRATPQLFSHLDTPTRVGTLPRYLVQILTSRGDGFKIPERARCGDDKSPSCYFLSLLDDIAPW